MIIKTSCKPSSLNDLAITLKKEFSNHYDYTIYGVKKDSVLVSKSMFIGAQISLKDNSISIQWSPSSVLGGLLVALSMTEVMVLLLPFIFFMDLPTEANKMKFIREIATFLKSRYN